MLKRIFALITILATLFGFRVADTVLMVKSPHGIDQTRAFYHQPKNSIDVILTGASHIHCGVNTGLLYEDYGIAAYDYSTAEQQFYGTYYYLKEMLKYQKPKAIVFDPFGTVRADYDYMERFVEENLFGMRFSADKWNMMKETVPEEDYEKYMPAFFAYHSRYSDLTREDLAYLREKDRILKTFKGYVPGFNVDPYDLNPADFGSASANPEARISDKNMEYLRKIIDLTQEEGIELFIVIVPVISTPDDEGRHLQIQALCEEEGVHYKNFIDCFTEIGMDFKTDFHDWSHLNYWGACKFTHALAEYLQSEIELPDRRGDARYSSWEDFAEEIRQKAANPSENQLTN